MFNTDSVFNRTHSNSRGELLGDAAYNLVIGLVLIWGFAVNWWMIQNIPTATVMSLGIFLLVGYIVSCLIGILIYSKSDNPFISFIGYNFIVAPLGLVLNLIVSQYDSNIVYEAVKMTGGTTIIMLCLGTMYPKFFFSISKALFLALIAMFIFSLGQYFITGKVSEWVDWVLAAIFCGYIGYDWARANSIPKTLDNAVDSAAALYIDIINLFIKILQILGRR